MSYKVINAESSGNYTAYTIERSDDGFKFQVRQHNNGGFSVRSLLDRQIGYSNEMREGALEAINQYKFKQTLLPKTAKTFEDIIDEL
jgi:hypothetical protein